MVRAGDGLHTIGWNDFESLVPLGELQPIG